MVEKEKPEAVFGLLEAFALIPIPKSAHNEGSQYDGLVAAIWLNAQLPTAIEANANGQSLGARVIGLDYEVVCTLLLIQPTVAACLANEALFSHLELAHGCLNCLS